MSFLNFHYVSREAPDLFLPKLDRLPVLINLFFFTAAGSCWLVLKNLKPLSGYLLEAFKKRGICLNQKEQPGEFSWKGPLSILSAFFSWYVYEGLKMGRTPAFSEFDILFQADVPRVIGDMTQFHFDHYRSQAHPIFLLLVNPLGVLLTQAFKNAQAVAVVVTAFVQGAAVALAFAILRVLFSGKKSALWACLFWGVSMNALFFGAVPETGAFASLSLMITYGLFLASVSGREVPFACWVLAGIFSTGMVLTNFVQTFVFFLISPSAKAKSLREKFIAGLALGLAVFVPLGLLAVLQKIIYPSSKLFFLPFAYVEDLTFVGTQSITTPVAVFLQLVKHFFVVNFIAGNPAVFTMPERTLKALTFSQSWNFSVWGKIALGLWSCLGLKAVLDFFKNPDKRFGRAILLSLMFNGVLHSFYGASELFIYTSNFSFLTLLFFAQKTGEGSRFTVWLWAGLFVFTAINNLQQWNWIQSFYQGG